MFVVLPQTVHCACCKFVWYMLSSRGATFAIFFQQLINMSFFGLAPLMSVAMLCRVVLGEPGHAHAGLNCEITLHSTTRSHST